MTPDDIRRARIIYGPALPTLKGKMVHTNPGIFEPIPRINIPAPINDEHRNVSLQIDFSFINGAPYLHTVSEHINYRTTHPCTNRGRSVGAIALTPSNEQGGYFFHVIKDMT